MPVTFLHFWSLNLTPRRVIWTQPLPALLFKFVTSFANNPQTSFVKNHWSLFFYKRNQRVVWNCCHKFEKESGQWLHPSLFAVYGLRGFHTFMDRNTGHPGSQSVVFRRATPRSRSFHWGAHSLNSLKGLSLIHRSQHGPSRVIAPGSSVLSPASPCRHRADIRRGPWRTSISVIKNKPCAIFCPGVHRWKMIRTTPGRHRVPSV